mmetsp:Transcript_5823/g.9001  ORF Transcript_5823/g.9001 Transcript_5823/m.9001 type:complete len:230 (+) Transcript_5823:153-842(+)
MEAHTGGLVLLSCEDPIPTPRLITVLLEKLPRPELHRPKRLSQLPRRRHVHPRRLHHRALHLHSRFHQIDNEAAHRSVPPAPRLRLHQRLVLPRVSRRQRHRHPAHARRRQRRRHRRRKQSIGADAEGDAVPTRANCLHRGRDGFQAQKRLPSASKHNPGVVLSHPHDVHIFVARVHHRGQLLRQRLVLQPRKEGAEAAGGGHGEGRTAGVHDGARVGAVGEAQVQHAP